MGDDVRVFFAEHASDYLRSESHREGADLGRLIARLELVDHPVEKALDVATGPGHTAVALGRLVHEVVGVDLTPEMKPVFERNAREHDLANLRFVLGDAGSLPFATDSFGLVTCRRAAHHFPDPERALFEIKRVLKPGGRLGLADMVAPEDLPAAELFNALERSRDGSHQRVLTVTQWRRVFESAGMKLLSIDESAEWIPFGRWLYPLVAGGVEEAAIRDELAQAAARTRKLIFREGQLLKRRLVAVAEKS